MRIYRFLSLIWAVAAGLALLGPQASADPRSGDIPTRGQVINIVEWNGSQLPPVYERSEQLPLSPADITQLSRNGFAPEAIATMVRERRYAGDASASGLIDLARAGVDPQVIQAVSLHALPPNRSIRFTVALAFEGASREARQRYLYVIVPDGEQERILTADLGSVIGGAWHQEEAVDHTDPILPRQVRRIRFSDRLPLKTYGPREMLVLTSARPDIQGSEDIPRSERFAVRRFDLDYPVSSPVQDCRLQIRYRQDPALPYKWDMTAAHLTCEWN